MSQAIEDVQRLLLFAHMRDMFAFDLGAFAGRPNGGVGAFSVAQCYVSMQHCDVYALLKQHCLGQAGSWVQVLA